ASCAVSCESSVVSCADDRPLANSQPPRANSAAAASPNATAKRSRIGMPSPALGRPQPVAHAPDRLDVLPTDLAPQVLHVLVDDVGAAVVGEIPDGLDDLRPGQHLARMPEEELEQGELLRGQLQLGPVPPGAL